MVQNKSVIFKKIPEGWPVEGEHLVVETHDFNPDAAPPAGGITTKNLYFSLDPYMRGRMRDPKIKSYTPAYEIGAPVQSLGIARVLKSDNGKYAAGDLVCAPLGMQEYSAVSSKLLEFQQGRHLSKLPRREDAAEGGGGGGIEPRQYLGALGMSGLTAYSSLLAIGEPKKGETMFVSSAAGSVGQLVGQMGKNLGLRVIGSVGSDDKLQLITEKLGFDAGFNYKKEKPADALKRLAPNGIDIYYENVGGEQLEAALDAMNDFGRVVACGMISQYNLKPADRYPLRNLMLIVSKRIKIQGFIVSDEGFGPKYRDEHRRVVSQWIREGIFKPVIDQTDGIDNAIRALLAMFKGENFGKALLKVADDDDETSKSSL